MMSRSKTKPKPTSLRRRTAPSTRAYQQHEVVDAALCAIVAEKDRQDGAAPRNATDQATASSPSDDFRVLGFAGFAQSGKDTAALAFPEYAKVALAGPIRKAALLINPIVDYKLWTGRCWFNPLSWFRQPIVVPVRLETLVNECAWEWEGAKQHPEIRRFLQRYGTEGGREIHGKDCWTAMAAEAILDAKNADFPGVVVTDVRFQDEADLIRFFNGPVVMIHRPGTWPVNSHVTDRVQLEPDITVLNDKDRKTLRATVRERVEAWYEAKLIQSNVLEGEGR